MPDYRRNRVPGGTYFFTVNLLERRRTLLTDNIELLRNAVRTPRRTQTFHVVVGSLSDNTNKNTFNS